MTSLVKIRKGLKKSQQILDYMGSPELAANLFRATQTDEKLRRDNDTTSNLAYKPQFISNNYKEGRKVISSIESELLSCDEFCISVAFITMGGITSLLQTLKELEKNNIPGKILTTDYLRFSQPEALKRLNSLNNIELKMYRTDYIFATIQTMSKEDPLLCQFHYFGITDLEIIADEGKTKEEKLKTVVRHPIK